MCYSATIMVIVKRLIWDAWNVAHIARHQVTPSEVEEVYQQKHLTRPSKKNRLAITGPTFAGRMLTVIIAPKEEIRSIFHCYCSTSQPKRTAIISRTRTRGR